MPALCYNFHWKTVGDICSYSYVNIGRFREHSEVISCNKYHKDILEKATGIIFSESNFCPYFTLIGFCLSILGGLDLMFTFLFCLYLFTFSFRSVFDKRPLLERVEMV